MLGSRVQGGQGTISDTSPYLPLPAESRLLDRGCLKGEPGGDFHQEISGIRNGRTSLTEPGGGGDLFAAALQCYRAALLDMGKSGYQVCPAFGAEPAAKPNGHRSATRRHSDGCAIAESAKDASRQLSQGESEPPNIFAAKRRR